MPTDQSPAASTHSGCCLCGHYRFSISALPLWCAYCHCESCRRFSGAPAPAYVGLPNGSVRFAPAEPPSFTSSPGVRRSFCETCGTPLAYRAEMFPGEVHLFRSTFEQPGAFMPTRHVLFNEREPGFDIYDPLPRYGSERGRVIAWGPEPAFRVLFLGSANSACSIVAEAVLNLRGARVHGRPVYAHSAGTRPAGTVRPEALALLKPHRHLLDRPRSKSWDEFTGPGAPPIDRLITLYDDAVKEPGPVLPGPAGREHWSLPNPASGAASFEATWLSLEERITALLEELQD